MIFCVNMLFEPRVGEGSAGEFGSQSVIVSLDVRKYNSGEYSVYVLAKKQRINTAIEPLIERFIEYGAGEILITSIDREGTLQEFDNDLFREIGNAVAVHLIFSGGAGSYDDMVWFFKETGCNACAVSKMLFLRDCNIV